MTNRWRFLAAVAAAAVLPALSAQAATWQDTHKTLRVGFLATDGAAYDLKKLEPFRAYLQSAIGMPVELVPAGDYAALIDAQSTDRVQYAIDSATAYVATQARCQCVAPLAVPAAFDGAKGFYAILLARADSAIQKPADAVGKTLAVTADDSVAGRLVPLHYLAAAGIDASTQFAAVMQASDPAAAIGALQTGMVDLAVGWSSMTGDPAKGYDFGVLTSLVQAGTLSMDQVRVVWQSPLIPFGPHVVRTDVPDDITMKLTAALSAMATTSPVALDAVDRSSIGGGGFVPVAVGDYAAIADLVGVDLTAVAPGVATSPPAVQGNSNAVPAAAPAATTVAPAAAAPSPAPAISAVPASPAARPAPPPFPPVNQPPAAPVGVPAANP